MAPDKDILRTVLTVPRGSTLTEAIEYLASQAKGFKEKYFPEIAHNNRKKWGIVSKLIPIYGRKFRLEVWKQQKGLDTL